jgi:hypothetical protein
MSSRWKLFAVGCLSVAIISCSKSDQPAKKPMTTAQRDSAIAESKLPGAGVVKKALEQSDSAKVRANRTVPEPR